MMVRHHEPNYRRTMMLHRVTLHHPVIIRRTMKIIIRLTILNNQPLFYSTLQLFSLSFPKWTASDEQQLQQQQQHQQHGRSHDRSNDCGRVTMIPCNVATTTCRCTIQSSTFTPHHRPSHNDNNNEWWRVTMIDCNVASSSVINRQPLHNNNNRMMTQQHHYYYCFPLIYRIPNGERTLFLFFSSHCFSANSFHFICLYSSKEFYLRQNGRPP